MNVADHPAGPGRRGHRRERPASTCPRARTSSARSGSPPRCCVTPTRCTRCRPASGRRAGARWPSTPSSGDGLLDGGRPGAALLELPLDEQVARVRRHQGGGGGGRRARVGPPHGPQLRPHPGATPWRRPPSATSRRGTCVTGRPSPSGSCSRPCWRAGWAGSTTSGWPCTAGWSAASTCPPTSPSAPRPRACRLHGPRQEGAPRPHLRPRRARRASSRCDGVDEGDGAGYPGRHGMRAVTRRPPAARRAVVGAEPEPPGRARARGLRRRHARRPRGGGDGRGGRPRHRARAPPDATRGRARRARARRPGRAAAVIVNAGALTHYSWSLHDALAAFDGVVVELHLSNPAGARAVAPHLGGGAGGRRADRRLRRPRVPRWRSQAVARLLALGRRRRRRRRDGRADGERSRERPRRRRSRSRHAWIAARGAGERRGGRPARRPRRPTSATSPASAGRPGSCSSRGGRALLVTDGRYRTQAAEQLAAARAGRRRGARGGRARRPARRARWVWPAARASAPWVWRPTT